MCNIARLLCTVEEKVHLVVWPLCCILELMQRPLVPSRRDDLEAAALMFIHLLTPRGLTWTRNGVPKSDSAHERLKREKRSATPEDLCRGLPSEFEEFLRYCRRLKFQETPNYAMWVDEFRQLALEQGYSGSDDFIWPPPKVQVRADIDFLLGSYSHPSA